MIKVRVHLDGNDYGYTTYTCNATMEQFLTYLSGSNPLVGLTEVDTNAFISIPIRRYVVEAWEVDE